MNVPDEQLDELIAIFTAVENGAVEAGAISFADALEGALPAALARHEQMVRAKVAEEETGDAVDVRAEIERQVRAKVAEEIEAQKISARGDWGAGWNKALTAVAEIARGES